ncbi:MAG: L,D-transpeptidase, partial [Planctomycetes bacterium]|nr:L,D-transpeptidase [Planctomycetota bacterium]
SPGTAPENPPVDEVYHNQRLNILETRLAHGTDWYRIGQDRWVHGGYVAVARFKPRPSSIGPTERWVGICLKEQTAVASEGDYPVYAAMTATGLPGTPTVQGIFRTWERVASARMVGPGYYLEDVTWTCYFYSGYALHTSYWHDAFGSPRSHGCINLSPYDAWWIFRWSESGGPSSPAVYVYWA